MPSIVPCETRSSPASPVQSPPRKKFKFSLKLKSKKKGNLKSASTGDNEHESKEQKCRKAECVQNNKEDKETTANGPSVQDDTSTSLADETEMVTPPLPFAGLANLGNTCYVSAVLQVLRYCPEFLKSLANLDEISAQNGTLKGQGTILTDDDSTLDNEDVTFSRPNIIRSVHKLTSEMENAEEDYNKMGMEAEQVKNRSGCTTLAVRPREFVKEFSGLRPMFGEYQQHDAQEFLRAFLSLVEEDCVGLVKGDQKDSVKENTMPPNSSESKVRGGCKYPNSNEDDIVETVAEPTSMMSTADSTRSEADCPEEQSNPTLSCASKTVTPKSFPNDFNCPKCAASSDDTNLVKRLFEGTLLLQTCCLNCEGVRRRYEKFQDISVPVQNSKHENSSDNLEEVNAFSDSEDESEKDVNLSWAISKFASVERLNGENKYFCDSCATLTEAEISTYFERLPRVLTIHLKRFQTSYGQSLYSSSWVTKVTKSLHTPQQLSLKQWCSKTCSERSAVYNLFGVVMHSGMSSCSGHYLSYVNVDILNDQDVVSGVSPRKPSKCGCGADENGDENTVCPKTDEEAMEIESDCIKEDVKAVDQDESCSSPWGADITRYFKPLRKSKVSVQKSTVGNLSCKEDTATCEKSTCSADSSGDKTPLTPAKICGQEPTDLSMNRHSTAETATNGEHSDPKCLDTSNTDSPVSTSHAKWLKFDDAEVQEISGKDMNEILSPSSSCYSTPYLLFYFRS